MLDEAGSKNLDIGCINQLPEAHQRHREVAHVGLPEQPMASVTSRLPRTLSQMMEKQRHG